MFRSDSFDVTQPDPPRGRAPVPLDPNDRNIGGFDSYDQYRWDRDKKAQDRAAAERRYSWQPCTPSVSDGGLEPVTKRIKFGGVAISRKPDQKAEDGAQESEPKIEDEADDDDDSISSSAPEPKLPKETLLPENGAENWVRLTWFRFSAASHDVEQKSLMLHLCSSSYHAFMRAKENNGHALVDFGPVDTNEHDFVTRLFMVATACTMKRSDLSDTQIESLSLGAMGCYEFAHIPRNTPNERVSQFPAAAKFIHVD